MDVDGDDDIAGAELGGEVLGGIVQHRRQGAGDLIGVHSARGDGGEVREHALEVAAALMHDLDTHACVLLASR